MRQHYRRIQRRYLQWRAYQEEKQKEGGYYIGPHLRKLRNDWFAKRLTEARIAEEKKRNEEVKSIAPVICQLSKATSSHEYHNHTSTRPIVDFGTTENRGRPQIRVQTQFIT